MDRGWYRVAVVGLVLVALVAEGPAAADEKKQREQNLYRYRDRDGVLVIDDSVPPEFAGAGYEVLSPGGRVIEVVPPMAPPAVVDEPGASANGDGAAVASEREDRFLLSSYSSVDDVVAAKQRKLAQFQREIDIARANRDRTLARRAVVQAQADGARQQGREPSASVLGSLRDLDREKANGEQLVTQREREYRDAELLYDRYAARFRVLKAASPAPPQKAPPLNDASDP